MDGISAIFVIGFLFEFALNLIPVTIIAVLGLYIIIEYEIKAWWARNHT